VRLLCDFRYLQRTLGLEPDVCQVSGR